MTSKRLRILDYPWHQVHLYRLCRALPADFTLLATKAMIWNAAQRPPAPNFLGAVDPDAVDPADYDLALMHLDQWCGEKHNLRALPYRIMKSISKDLPRVVIMHGTPDNEANRLEILRLIGNEQVVCNSWAAALEWDGGENRASRYGLPQFRPIIHGYVVDEFWSEPLEKRRLEIVTICSGGSTSRIYHGLPLVERLMRDVPLAHLGPAGNRNWCENYDAYRRMMAETLIYFSPTRRAPMPGARTEAMLSGCCIVSVPGNDVEDYIIGGKTGFVVQNYIQARDTLRALLAHPDLAYEIGQAGREAARKLFAAELLRKEWLALLGDIGVRL